MQDREYVHYVKEILDALVDIRKLLVVTSSFPSCDQSDALYKLKAKLYAKLNKLV